MKCYNTNSNRKSKNELQTKREPRRDVDERGTYISGNGMRLMVLLLLVLLKKAAGM